MTKRSKRRIFLLIILLLTTSSVISVAYLVRQSFKNDRKTEMREAGKAAFEAGDWDAAMSGLGYAVSQDLNDTEALLMIADARQRVPQEGGAHIKTALQFFVQAETAARKTGDTALIIRSLEGQIAMTAMLSQLSRLESTCFELLDTDPGNKLALASLRKLQSVRGNYLPSDVSLVVRGDRSNSEWLSALSAVEDNSVLRWSLEMEAESFDTEYVTRSLILASLRVGNSEESQRLNSGVVSERPTDIAIDWSEEDPTQSSLVLLALQQLQDDELELALEVIRLVDESSLTDPNLVYVVLEIRNQFPQDEENISAIATLTERGRQMAIADPTLGVSIAEREWQAGKIFVARELVKQLFTDENLFSLPIAVADAAVLGLLLEVEIPETAREVLASAGLAEMQGIVGGEKVRLASELLQVVDAQKLQSKLPEIKRLLFKRNTSRDWSALNCVLGDLLLEIGQNSMARNEWRSTLGLGSMIPVRIRLIRSLRADGELTDAFREAIDLARVSRSTRSFAELCESWIAIEQVGLKAEILEPGFDRWESPLELAEQLSELVGNSGGNGSLMLPMIVDAAILEGRPDIAESTIDLALQRKIGWQSLRRISQAVIRGSLDRVEQVIDYAVQLDETQPKLGQRVLITSSLLRAEGRESEAIELVNQELVPIEPGRVRDSLGLELIVASLSNGSDVGELADTILAGSFGIQVIDALLDAAVTISDIATARRAVEHIEMLPEALSDAVKAALGIARAKYTLAFERDDPNSLRLAILEIDALARERYLDAETRFLWTQLLAASEASVAERIESLGELVESQPGFLMGHVRLVEALQDDGQLSESRVILDDLLRRFDSADARIQRRIAIGLDRQGLLDEAAVCFCKLFDQSASAETGLLCLTALRRVGKKDEASIVLERLALLELEDPRIVLQLAASMIEQDDSKGAAELIRSSESFGSRLEQELAIARLQFNYGRNQELKATLESGADIFETSADAKLISALLILGDSAGPDVGLAKSLLQDAVRLGGSSPGILSRATLMAVEFEGLRSETGDLLVKLASIRPWEARIIGLRYGLMAANRMEDPSAEEVAESREIIAENKQSPAGWALGLRLMRARYLSLLESGDVSGAIDLASEIEAVSADAGKWAGRNLGVSTNRISALAAIGEFESAWEIVESDASAASEFGLNELLMRLSVGMEAKRYRQVGSMLGQAPASSSNSQALRNIESLIQIRLGQVIEAWEIYGGRTTDRTAAEWPMPFLVMLMDSNPDEVIVGVRAVLDASKDRAVRLAAISILVAAYREHGDERLSALAEKLAEEETGWTPSQRWALKMAQYETEGAKSDLSSHLSMSSFISEFGAERLADLEDPNGDHAYDERERSQVLGLVAQGLNNSVSFAAKAIIGGSLSPVQRNAVIAQAQKNLKILDQMFPDVPEITDTRAEFEIAIGDPDSAIQFSELAIAKQPFRPHFRVTLARALLEVGRLNEARRQLVLAIHLARRKGESGSPDRAAAENLLQEM